MREPFTRAVKRLKNNKSPGEDGVKAEMLKYSPDEVHQEIADILNEIAMTGEAPEAVRKGILIPLPKPGKPHGPPANVRPIILSSLF